MEKGREKEEEQETIEIIQEKIKKVLFQVNNHLLKHLESFSPYIYYLLIIIQTLQILWYSIHPTFTFISQSIGIQELRTAISYFSLEYHLRSNPGSWAVCTIVAFVIIILHTITLSVTGYFLLKNPLSEATEMMAKISNFQILLMNTVLTGPLFNIVITTLYCNAESPYHLGETCYTPTAIAYCVLATIVGVVLVVEGALFSFLYYIKNPFSRGCLSTPSNIYYIGKLCLKTLPSLYFIIDYDLEYIHVYIFAYVIVFAGYLFFFRMFSHHTYNQKYFYFIYSCELALTWIGLVNILQFYLSDKERQNLNIIFSLAGIIPLSFTFIKLERESKKKIFLEGIRNLKKNKEVAEEFIYMLISLIETSHVHKNKIQLLGYMKIHNGGCQQEDSKCSCHQFFEGFYQKKKLSPAEQLQQFYEFLKHVLIDNIKKYSGHVMFKIIYAYLLYYKLDSKIQSIYYLTETSKEKLSFVEDFMVLKLKLLFEEESEEKENDLSQDKGHAVKIYLEFNTLYNQLEDQIESCAKNHLEYWRELKEDFPSVLKLWNLAKHFQIQVKNISSLFLKISDIFANNIMTLILYSNFLKYIVLDQTEYQKLKEKIKTQKFSAESQANDNNQMKFRENSNLCTITITTYMNNIGIVINANSELQRILGYSKTELVGQKITKIMPKLYYDLHDNFVIKYLNRPDKEIESTEFTVFALCKKGFLVECNILTKLVPEIKNGFHLVGFIKKIEQTSRYFPHYIMYDGDSYNIEAVSETCVDSLGLTTENIQKAGGTSNITVNYLFPEVDFDELDNRPQLKLQGFQTIIDTRVLSQNYVAHDSYSADEETDYNKNGKMNVKVYLAKQSTYGKLKLKFIKFFILNEDEEHIKSQKSVTEMEKEGKQGKEEDVQSEEAPFEEENEKSTNDVRKYSEFVSQGSIKCLLVLLWVGVYVFMAMQISLMSFDVARNIIDSSQLSFSLDVLNQSCTLLNCLNNANFDTKKLKLAYQLNMTQSDFKRYQLHMRESALYMQSSMVQFFRTSVDLESRLSYYQQKIYSNYYFYNNNDPPILQTFEYNDALFEYISTIISFSSYSYESLNVPVITNTTIAGNFYFVETNGMSTMFFTTITNQVNIFDFFKFRFDVYLKSRQVLLGLRIFSVMIIFCLIFPIVLRLNKINNKLLAIYRLIPISDIQIIERGSLRFLLSNFEDCSVSKPDEEPEISAHSNQIHDEVQSKLEQSSFLPLITNPGAFSPSSTFRPAETSDALLISSIDEQKVLLKRNSLVKDIAEERRRIPRVKLSKAPSNKSQIVLFLIVVMALLGYCVGQYFIHFYFFDPMEADQYIMTYYKTAISTNRQTLLNAQEYFSGGGDVAMVNFKRSYDMLYFNLDSLYVLEKDINKNREIVYGSVEQLQSLFTNYSMATLNTPKFKRIEASIDQVEINLINESNDWMLNTQDRYKNSFQKVCFIKFGVELAVVILLIKILFSRYFQKVKTRTRRSISMAQMIPLKIITKNPDIVAIL